MYGDYVSTREPPSGGKFSVLACMHSHYSGANVGTYEDFSRFCNDVDMIAQ
jgi:hypothetical protein